MAPSRLKNGYSARRPGNHEMPSTEDETSYQLEIAQEPPLGLDPSAETIS